jgi:hypothetical protein
VHKICPACRFDRCDETATTCRQCGAAFPDEDAKDEVHHSLTAAWFHYLQVPDLGTLELTPGRAFLLGNDARSDLLLKRCPDKEAARIYWTDGFHEATVEPNKGSKWTVKVDGVFQGKSRTLKGGEEVSVGPLHFKYLKRGTIIEGARKLNRKSKAPPGASVGMRGGGIRGPGSNKGAALEPNVRSIKPISQKPNKKGSAPPAAVARKLEKDKAYATLRVETSRGKGWISIMSGAPKHASYGTLKGIKAVEAILRLPACRVEIEEGLPNRGASKEAIENVTFSQVLAKLNRGRKPTAKPGARPGARPARPGARPGARPARPGARPKRGPGPGGGARRPGR